MTFGKVIALGFIIWRDAWARLLIFLRITPNVLTLIGMAITAAAGVCYALGAGAGFAWSFGVGASKSAWLLLAAICMFFASACDMLDGAVARIGNKKTVFGAFLDSTLDRCSDFAVFAGIAVYYATPGHANVTLCLLSMLAFFNSYMISYARARAEDLIDHCTVGYWQRGERSAAILIGTCAYNIPAMVVQQGILTLFTWLRRVAYTQHVLAGKKPIEDPRKGPWHLKIRLWRWPRMTWAYDIVTGLNIAWLIFAPVPAMDPIGAWLGAVR